VLLRKPYYKNIGALENYFGNTTASTTWIKPFEPVKSVATSVHVAFFSSIKITLPSLIETTKLPPVTVFNVTDSPLNQLSPLIHLQKTQNPAKNKKVCV